MRHGKPSSSLSSLTRDFNRESSELEISKDPAQQSSSIDGLFTDSEPGYFDGDSKLSAMRLAPHWCRFFGIADTLAKKRQSQFRNDWFALFVLSFVAFFLFAMSAHIDSRPGALLFSKYLLAGYMIVIGVVFALFIRARLRRDQERYLHYRAFAEALRVAIYWSLLGIVGPAGDKKRAFDDDTTTGTISTVTGYYPIKRPSELAWIKICLRTLDLCHQAAAPTDHGVAESEAHTVARRFWVRGQLSYFERQGTLHNRHAEALENWSIIILVTTPFFLVPLLLSAIGDSQFLGLSLHEVFLIATGILPGIAAFLTGYSERLALTAQARQYDRMRMLFKRAYDLLPERLDTDTAQYVWSLYRELGIEAMRESADWVSIYQQRPIQPVQ